MSGAGEGFWAWALAAYARPGAAEACLELQDAFGQCVPGGTGKPCTVATYGYG